MSQAFDLIGQRKQRLEKIEKLRSLGIDPYPAHSQKDLPNQQITTDYNKLEGQKICLTGRIMSWRTHGKVIFADIVDQSGRAQAYIRYDVLTADLAQGFLGWEQLELIDDGDFVEICGEVTKTQNGEPSILVSTLRMLAKSLRPLPDTLENKELRYRRRYLDLIANPEVRERFERKAHFWEVNRDFLKQKGFIEVETPVLEHVTGGADARPFVTHHNDLDQNFYLRISTELYQKRLIGGGFEKVFTIGPNFRNEGVSDEHLQEYYQVEWYWAYADYRDNMKLVKDMFRHIAKEVYQTTKFTTREHTFDLADEWVEIDYVSVIKERYGVDIFDASEEDLMGVLKAQGVVLEGDTNRNRLVDNLWKLIRKTIAGPAFLINEPTFMSPLAKAKPEDARLTERFHVVIGGSELGNGYSEINDPLDQLQRFLEQQTLRDRGDDEAQMLDIDYVEMLEYGMPPTSGYGHSERLFWFLEDVTAREGTLFPLMKFDLDHNTQKIYHQLGNMLDVSIPNDDSVTSEDVSGLPQRNDAEKLLETHVSDEYQKMHARMVATVLEKYASEYQGNPDLWYITGLLHDLDYGEYPEEHPRIALGWFEEWGLPKDLVHAIAAHAGGRTGVVAQTKLAKALWATDELSGFLYAYALMRGGYESMNATSVKKKLKDKSFAAKIDREEIYTGVESFGVDLDTHINFLITVFQESFPLNQN